MTTPLTPIEAVAAEVSAAGWKTLREVVEGVNAQLSGRWFGRLSSVRTVVLNLPDWRTDAYEALVAECSESGINGDCWPDAVLNEVAKRYRAAGWGVDWASGSLLMGFYRDPSRAPEWALG